MIDEHTDEWRLSQFKHFHQRIVGSGFTSRDVSGEKAVCAMRVRCGAFAAPPVQMTAAHSL